ncbi:hypothetical protein CHUAL_008980 [Chamberlinius hualienensis]
MLNTKQRNKPMNFVSSFRQAVRRRISFKSINLHNNNNKSVLSNQTTDGIWWQLQRRYLRNLVPNSNAVSLSSIKQFLVGHGIGYLEGYTSYVVECRFCKKKIHEKSSDWCKIYINMTTGDFVCLKCQVWGSWQDFQDIIHITTKGDKQKSTDLFSKDSRLFPSSEELKPVLDSYKKATVINSQLNSDLQMIVDDICQKEFSNAVLEKYEARVSVENDLAVLLPIYTINGIIVGLTRLTKSTDNNDDGSPAIQSDVLPKNFQSALFGYQRLSMRQESIVISSNPIDTLSLADNSRINVVNLPQSKCLPLEVLPLLEPFKRIIFWFDKNIAMWQMAKVFAKKLNEKRCYVIRSEGEYLTASEAVRRKFDVTNLLKMARPISHRSITTFHSLRQDVYLELTQAEQFAGVKWKRFPLLNKLLKGHRRGELTIFTGPTGSGKTTFISEYSLDLCIQGVRTLWGSFEIKNTRLAKIMMMQFSQCSLDKSLETFDVWADKFESLPLFFLTFHGPESVKNVLDAMKHAVYIHDIEHVVVDNLQFMLGTSDINQNYDRFWKQDLVIAAFRQFATVCNCHVTMVIHPRKEESDELNNMSIFGGAKATQEADNVLILQNKMTNTLRGKKYVQVTKNRYDGELGLIPLDFDKETRSFAFKKKTKSIDEKEIS